ncbi:hypothetical protein NliqN6_4659 [Naganishia liquefaciens]|uniref:RanBD1 domain-containing protein n=1 Tax=Naganishia liquefaciens TaxID=104408 RepID=A0A8H3YHJ5_9TREE|nr:hypothetical protein NliqN6_4659 [Naganishia liquefaciens]
MAVSDNESTSKVSEEVHGRKRGRETSVEPGLGQSTSGSVASIPVKKNRTETLASAQSSRGSSPARKGDSNGGLTTTSSDETVKEVQQKVEDLSHDESSAQPDQEIVSEKSGVQSVIMGEEAEQSGSDAGRKRKQEDRTPSSHFLKEDTKRVRDTQGEDAEPPVSAVPSVDMDRPNETSEKPSEDLAALKKAPTTFGSFASTSSPFAKMAPPSSVQDDAGAKGLPDDVSAKVKEANALPTPPLSSESIAVQPTVKKPQASFGSFAASASPFSAVKHTSAFATQSVASSSNATAHSASPFKAATGSAFGNWSASASPFATPSRKATPRAEGSNADAEETRGDKGQGDKGIEGAQETQHEKNFGDILASTSGEASAEKKKVDVQQQEVPTGEEEENTIFQVRSKLHVMDGGAWKERGTGSLHLNVHKKDKSARLVMRAEGVFRLILNTPLYAGMKVELTDRYVKFPIVEEGKIRNIAIRTRNMDEATGLHDAMQRHIPAKDVAESSSSTPAPVGEEAV